MSDSRDNLQWLVRQYNEKVAGLERDLARVTAERDRFREALVSAKNVLAANRLNHSLDAEAMCANAALSAKEGA